MGKLLSWLHRRKNQVNNSYSTSTSCILSNPDSSPYFFPPKKLKRQIVYLSSSKKDARQKKLFAVTCQLIFILDCIKYRQEPYFSCIPFWCIIKLRINSYRQKLLIYEDDPKKSFRASKNSSESRTLQTHEKCIVLL